jgi:hypothetical protein
MASRKEQKEALREERLAQERAAASGERRRRILGYGVGVLIAVVALGAIVFVALSPGAEDGPAPVTPSEGNDFPEGKVPPAGPLARDLPAAARAAGCTVKSERSEGNDHVGTPVRYRANPPHSGDHNIEPVEDGAYRVPPGRVENMVHTLEHGRIHIQYRPTAPDPVKGNLKALYDEDPYHVLLTPNVTRMPYEVAATAWQETLTCPRENPRVYDAIRAFTEAHRDRGPEYVP